MENIIVVHRKIKSEILRIEKLKNYVGKTAEVMINIMHDNANKLAAGYLHKYSKTKLFDEKSAWEIIAKEKHANN
jgi:hypothetical protein